MLANTSLETTVVNPPQHELEVRVITLARESVQMVVGLETNDPRAQRRSLHSPGLRAIQHRGVDAHDHYRAAWQLIGFVCVGLALTAPDASSDSHLAVVDTLYRCNCLKNTQPDENKVDMNSY